MQVRLDAMQFHRPRHWGACWLAWWYEQLGLGHFWQACLTDRREGTRWRHLLQTLVVYRPTFDSNVVVYFRDRVSPDASRLFIPPLPRSRPA